MDVQHIPSSQRKSQESHVKARMKTKDMIYENIVREGSPGGNSTPKAHKYSVHNGNGSVNNISNHKKKVIDVMPDQSKISKSCKSQFDEIDYDKDVYMKKLNNSCDDMISKCAGEKDIEDMIASNIITKVSSHEEEASTKAVESLGKDTSMKIPTFQDSQENSNSQRSPHNNNSTKSSKPKGSKKVRKKKRFRNLYGSSDEECDTPALDDSYKSVLTKCGTMITGSMNNINSDHESPTTSTLSNQDVSTPKEKVHILQEFVFTLPNLQPKSESISPSLMKQSPSIRKVDSEFDSDLYISDDSLCSIQSKISLISGVNLNGSLDLNSSASCLNDDSQDLENMQKNEESDVVQLEDANDISIGERFWAYDDDGQLVCLEKADDGGLILVSTDLIEEEDDEEVLSNNNTPQIDNKESEVLSADGEIRKQDMNPNNQKLESDLFPEPLADVGNEEIISQIPEDECQDQVPCSPLQEEQEPFYIMNDPEPAEIKALAGVTPLEYAFVQALNDLREADTAMSVALGPVRKSKRRKQKLLVDDVPEAQVTFTPIKADLETLMKGQDQCSIEELDDSKADFDYDYKQKTTESLAEVNRLASLDIAKMILGEGWDATLVSEQEQAMDLLQLPPDYEPKPILLKPSVPVTISPLITDTGMLGKGAKSKSTGNGKLKTKKNGVVENKKASGLHKTKKKKHKMMKIKPMLVPHITGDSDTVATKRMLKMSFVSNGNSPGNKKIKIKALPSPAPFGSNAKSKGKASPFKTPKVSPLKKGTKNTISDKNSLTTLDSSTSALKVSPLKKGAKNTTLDKNSLTSVDNTSSALSLSPVKKIKQQRSVTMDTTCPSNVHGATSTPYKVSTNVQFTPLEEQLRKEYNLGIVSVSLDSKEADKFSLEYNSTSISPLENSQNLQNSSETSLNLLSSTVASSNKSFQTSAGSMELQSPPAKENHQIMLGRKAKKMRKRRIRWGRKSETNLIGEPLVAKTIDESKEIESTKQEIDSDNNSVKENKEIIAGGSNCVNAVATRMSLRRNKLNATESEPIQIQTNDLITSNVERKQMDLDENHHKIKEEMANKVKTEDKGPELQPNDVSTSSLLSMSLEESLSAATGSFEKVSRVKIIQRGDATIPLKTTEEVEKRKTRSSSSRRSEVMGLCSKYLVMRKSTEEIGDDLELSDTNNAFKISLERKDSDMDICSNNGTIHDSILEASDLQISTLETKNTILNKIGIQRPKAVNISSLNDQEISISIGGTSKSLLKDNHVNNYGNKTPDRINNKKKRNHRKSSKFSIDSVQLHDEPSKSSMNEHEQLAIDDIKSESEEEETEHVEVSPKTHKMKKQATTPILKINLKSLITQKAAEENQKNGKLHKEDASTPRKSQKKKKKSKSVEHEEDRYNSQNQAGETSLIKEIKIEEDDTEEKAELTDDHVGVDTSPKVPKIILKLSPHRSPSIVKPTPHASKQKLRKRKILSPIIIKSPGNDNSTNDNDAERKPKKRRDSDVIYVENNTSPQIVVLTDDPEVITNINKENSHSTPTPLSLMADVKEENDENVEIKIEPPDAVKEEIEDCTYPIGDLILARLGTFCFWPCMIIEEMESGLHVRCHGKHVRYHVRFFGDNGRRAWVPKTSIISYKGMESLTLRKNELVNIKKHCTRTERSMITREMNACTVNPRVYGPWKIGMNEAESLIDKTVAQRHDFFNNMFAAKNEKRKRKRPQTETDTTISKQESVVDVPENETAFRQVNNNPEVKINQEKEEKDEDTKSRPLKKRKITKQVSTIQPQVHKSTKSKFTNAPPNLEADGRMRRSERVSSGKQAAAAADAEKTSGNNKDVDNVSLEQAKRNYVLEDLELINKGSLIQESAVAAKEEPLEAVLDEEVTARNIMTRRGSSIRLSDNKKLDLFKTTKIKGINDGASEVSDTDSSTKISIQSTGSKRVLFKDVPRLPVCHICLRNDAIVLKCKGTCCCFYHPRCSQVKEEPKEESNVEIVSIKAKSKYFDKDQVNLNESDLFDQNMDLIDKLDNKLQKIMAPISSTTIYHGSTTEDSEDGGIDETHLEESKTQIEENFMCVNCLHQIEQPCHACGSTVYLEKHVDRFRCSVNGCGKYFHKECLKCWPQTVIKSKQHDPRGFSFTCPMHNCQTCISDNPKACTTLLPIVKTARCLKCPGTYHINSFCIPAGTQILNHTQIICPRHVDHKGKRYTINANWCFICSRGGDLLCCETCPTSVHQSCISINLRADDTFVCEDCESGRLALYDDIVWAKFAHYKWWPGVVLFPEDIPDNVKNVPHRQGEFVVKFYGTHDHHWFALGRVFHFQEDDREVSSSNRRDLKFQMAINEARSAVILQKELRKQREMLSKKGEKPSKFIKIKMNRYIGNVKPFDGNISNTNPCACDANSANPCGPDSDCLNRLLLTECDPNVCPASEKCLNQRFEKRNYPPLMPVKTERRGWGLACTEALVKGQFIIEYVGEVIDHVEYHRRIELMNEQKTENYYFLTIDKNRTIDAGPKGNLSRFMNHCCKPNCETQKWTVRGETRVGLFAKENIPANTELTFNYNMETIGKVKKECHCGADNCAGFLGSKLKEFVKKSKKPQRKMVSNDAALPVKIKETIPCFICDKNIADIDCTVKGCGKSFHLKCLEIGEKPKGKFACPRHFCNTCTKKKDSIQSCRFCLQSYCMAHRHKNIKFNRKLGYYLCNRHNSDENQSTNLTKPQDETTLDGIA